MSGTARDLLKRMGTCVLGILWGTASRHFGSSLPWEIGVWLWFDLASMRRPLRRDPTGDGQVRGAHRGVRARPPLRDQLRARRVDAFWSRCFDCFAFDC